MPLEERGGPGGRQPLERAAWGHNIGAMKLLLDEGVRLTARTLFTCCSSFPKGFELIMKERRHSPALEEMVKNARDSEQYTMLYRAPVGLCDALVAAGADPLAATDTGWTTLHSAVEHNQMDKLAKLLQHVPHGSVDLKGYDSVYIHDMSERHMSQEKRTPIEHALLKEKRRSLRAAFRTRCRGGGGIHAAAKDLAAGRQTRSQESEQCLQLLLDHGADPDKPMPFIGSPRAYAKKNGIAVVAEASRQQKQQKATPAPAPEPSMGM